MIRPNIMEKMSFKLSLERWVGLVNTELGRRQLREQDLARIIAWWQLGRSLV